MGKPTIIVLLSEHSNRTISDDGALLYAVITEWQPGD